MWINQNPFGWTLPFRPYMFDGKKGPRGGAATRRIAKGQFARPTIYNCLEVIYLSCQIAQCLFDGTQKSSRF